MVPCSYRLQKILSWVDGNVIADIGCDHAYVCVNAVLNGQSQKAYACDVGLGPLENAKKTIQYYNVEDKVFPILSNGIENLQEDVDQIIICGMGGKLISEILSKKSLKQNVRLLLSPHKDAAFLRLDLQKHCIHIVKEKMIHDGNHYYPLMDCIVKNTVQDLESAEIHFGKNICVNEEYLSYLKYEENKYTDILKRVKKKDLQDKIEMIHKIRIQSMS